MPCRSFLCLHCAAVLGELKMPFPSVVADRHRAPPPPSSAAYIRIGMIMKTPFSAAALLLTLLLAAAAMAVKDGLLPNGNFEDPPSLSELNRTVVLGRFAIPRWEVSGFVEYIESGHKQGDMLLVVPEGAYAVRLGNEASIKQRLVLAVGGFYAFTFSAARTCAQEEVLNVSVTPDSGVLPVQTMYSSSGWDSYAWACWAKVELVELVIHNPGVVEDPACGPLIDSIAIRALSPPKMSSSNLLKNGDMEEGPYIFPNASWGVLIPPHIEDDHSPLPGWMVESLKAVKYIDSGHFSVPSGERAVELVAGEESALAQNVRTVPGKAYALTFAVGDAGDRCEGPMVVEALAARGVAKVPYESAGTGGHRRAELRFVAVADRTRVVFRSSFYHSKSDGSLCGPVVDDVKLLGIRGPSPSPSSPPPPLRRL